MYSTLRPWLFRLEPERAHNLTIALLQIAGMLPLLPRLIQHRFTFPSPEVQAFGLRFPNPVGLAAGYDKDGRAWRGLACLGFGHIEIGTVTLLPQPGNPRPRIFRLPEERALINRMGFPGRGAGFVARQLKNHRPAGLVLGVNIGKNKDTPLEEAFVDYTRLMRIFAPLADYLTINVSSPNTLGLRRLQAKEELAGLLSELAPVRFAQVELLHKPLPLLVKLAPDLEQQELDDALGVLVDTGMDGVIATNTTLARDGIASPLGAQGGGLSGLPLRRRSLEVVRNIVRLTGGKLPVIGVGGIENSASAQEFLDAGAVLVQVYTGLVYQGPGLVRQILAGQKNPKAV